MTGIVTGDTRVAPVFRPPPLAYRVAERHLGASMATTLDLRTARYDQFVAAVFDHPADGGAEAKPWYRLTRVELVVDPARQVEHMTRAFREARALAGRYSPAQLEAGLWFMGCAAQDDFVEHLWNAGLPWEAREACIAAMESLYADCLARLRFETIDYMWPDLLAYDYQAGHRAPSTDPEDARVQVALLALFDRLLARPEAACQQAALHGLGHLAHPAAPARITAYLEQHPELTASQREFAAQAMAGALL